MVEVAVTVTVEGVLVTLVTVVLPEVSVAVTGHQVVVS